MGLETCSGILQWYSSGVWIFILAATFRSKDLIRVSGLFPNREDLLTVYRMFGLKENPEVSKSLRFDIIFCMP